MPKTDAFETEILEAYENRDLASVASAEELARVRDAARATGLKDRRVNIRLSASDLKDLQTRALLEGMPYRERSPQIRDRATRRSLARGRSPDAGRSRPAAEPDLAVVGRGRIAGDPALLPSFSQLILKRVRLRFAIHSNLVPRARPPSFLSLLPPLPSRALRNGLAVTAVSRRRGGGAAGTS